MNSVDKIVAVEELVVDMIVVVGNSVDKMVVVVNSDDKIVVVVVPDMIVGKGLIEHMWLEDCIVDCMIDSIEVDIGFDKKTVGMGNIEVVDKY